MHNTAECAWCTKIAFNDSHIPINGGELPARRRRLNPRLGQHERGTWAYPVDLAIYDSFPEFQNLATASHSGCSFAVFLKAVLESADVQCQLDDDICDFSGRRIPFKLVFAYAWGVFEPGAGNSGLEALRITIHLDTAEEAAYDKIPPFHIVCRVHDGPEASSCSEWLEIERPYTIPRIFDQDAVSWMRSQLANCDERKEQHQPHCGPNYTKGFLPHRLIDIQGSTLEVVRRADILESLPTGDSIPHYAALSYCWGSLQDAANQLTLLTSCLKKGRFIFSPHDVPVVVRDAVAVAQSLSLRYLWVDALCIVQDDLSDWETESSQMNQIYGCAYITICSLTASCNLSFLDPEILTTAIAFQSSINHDVRGQYAITYSYCVSLRSGAGILVDRLMENRWSRRGWTFQEALLSERFLCFEQYDVSFSCSDRVAYLSGHVGERPIETLRMMQVDIRKPQESIWAVWYQLVLARYCDRIFTNREDVLPAISGVARVFHKTFGANYVAGLWDTDLAVGLMWEVEANRHRGDLAGLLRSQQPTTLTDLLKALVSPPYVAPSWSWAGRQVWIDSPIVSYSQVWRDVQDECQMSASVTVAGCNPFGRLKDAWIDFSGTVVHIGPHTAIRPSGEFPGHYGMDLDKGGSIICRFDWYVNATVLRGRFKMALLGSFIENPEADNDPGARTSNPRDQVQTAELEARERTAFGIILHKDPRSNDFLRVGVFFSMVSKGGGLRHFGFYGAGRLRII